MKARVILSTCMSLLICATAAICSGGNQSSQMVKIAEQRGVVRIVCPKSSDESEMARYLVNYLQARGFAVNPNVADKYSAWNMGPQWILATSKSLKTLGVRGENPKFSKANREEAFYLDVHPSGHKSDVLIVGNGISGLRSGVVRLIEKMGNDGKSLWIMPGREFRDPFIRLRILTASNAARRQAPMNSPFREADCQTWSQDRLAAYPELFWQMGFNGMQVDEDRGYGSVHGDDLARIQRALKTMMSGAQKHHMFISLSQWGDCLFNEGEAYCWNDPSQHKTMLSFMDELAGNYANLVDNITIRVGDPGGCSRNGCESYKTPQQLTAAYLQAFRKINPRIGGTLSVWANSGLWIHSPKKLDLSNYAPMFTNMANQKEYAVPLGDGAKFLDETYMPKDVSISLNRYYNADQAEAVLAAGREVDIKGWYIADMEMIDNICINMHTVDQLFGAMPDKARDQVRSQSVELCFDGWPEIIGQYVAAQKLWNPRLKLADLEKEFCTAAFGPKNADAMVALYDACENGDPGTTARPIPAPADFGTPAYNAHLRQVLTEAMSVKIEPGWKPNFALPVPAQKYVDMLTARLQLIIAVSEAKEKISVLKGQGADEGTIAKFKQEAMSKLPVLPIDPLYKQDASVVDQSFRSVSFSEMIERL